jgi:hypothetical protein
MADQTGSLLGDADPRRDVMPAAEAITLEERRQVVRQAQVLIEHLFVYLPLERAMRAVDPVQRLPLLERRLETYTDPGFHDEMINIFSGLRALHTNYVLPEAYAGRAGGPAEAPARRLIGAAT